MEEFRRTGRGGRGLNEDGPEGAEAPVGTYRVTLTVDGTDYVGSVTVRDDPMLAEGGR